MRNDTARVITTFLASRAAGEHMRRRGMKKDFTRDYTTEIFRIYALAGMPTYEEAREKIFKEELKKRSSVAAEEALAQAEIAVEKRTPYLLDILAAEKTFELLRAGDRTEIAKAVKAVYCVNPSHPLQRGDITNRVRRFALEYPADARTVYRWLKGARLLCAAVRGLRISDDDAKKYRISL